MNTEGQSGGVVDSDADGLSDAWEQSHFGDLSEDGSGDPDGDGYVNIEEQDFGLDPNVIGGLPGYLSHDVWFDVAGTQVDDLVSNEKFFQTPDVQELVLGLETSQDDADSFGRRLRGTLLAPITGSYTFWVSGDDGVELWLSTDQSKFNRRKIAWHHGASGPQEWERFATQRSAPISLQSGQKYYLEILHKEHSLLDHVSVAWSYEADDLTNVARSSSAVATQSSTRNGGAAQRAVDGNTEGRFSFNSVTHTDSEENSWWQVDLGSEQAVQKIVLYNRNDPNDAPKRLSNFRVSVLNDAGAEVFGRDFYTEEGYVDGSLTVELEAPVQGRVVQVTILGYNLFGDGVLSLAEVEVMSSASGMPNMTPLGYLGYLTNWTQESGVVATQSSTRSRGSAARAIDGNRDGNFSNGSVTHTADEENSWWQVDLGVQRPVNRIAIYNRTGGAQTRLSNFRILALDDAGLEVASEDFYLEEGFAPYDLKWDLPLDSEVRTVRVERLGVNRAGDHVLSLAEVEVLGSLQVLVNEIQAREVIPFGALESYVSDPLDPDDDYMPSDWEVLYGLDPNSAQDVHGGAFGDPDGDLIANWQECLIGFNPLVPESLPGTLTEEFWTGVEGEDLSDFYQNPKFLEGPDYRRFLHASEASRWLGDNTASRIRGYLTAPETGTYFFWLSGDDEVRFWMSDDDDKFNKELLIAPHLHVGYQDYDAEASQKSRTVDLVAGERYFIELQWKEARGGGGSPVSLAWQAPGGERELIPSDHLSSYSGHPNDVDDDELPDDWESANGLDPNDNGAINPANGYAGDLDGDGLTNFAEFEANTRADLLDSDGDGVDDYTEVSILDTNALVGDVAPFQLESTVNGASFIASGGSWSTEGTQVYSRDTRGWVDYEINVPFDGVYLLETIFSPRLSGGLSSHYEFIIGIDGIDHGRVAADVDPDESGTVSILTPWLTAGVHTVRVFDDNAFTYRRINIESLRLLSAQGSCQNNYRPGRHFWYFFWRNYLQNRSNKTPDWVQNYLESQNDILTQVAYSKVSPARIEGIASSFERLSITGGSAPVELANQGWVSELTLHPYQNTTLVADFESGGLSKSINVSWVETNLLQESSIALVQGDSLMLNAFTGFFGNGSDQITLTIDGVDHSFKGNQPLTWQFDTIGTHVIDVVHQKGRGRNARQTTNQVTIEVIANTTVDSPAVLKDHVRPWTIPALPAGAIIEFDDHVEVREVNAQADGSSEYFIVSDTEDTVYATVRLGEDGAVLQSIPVRGLTVRDAEATSVTFVQDLGNDTYQVDMPTVVSTVHDDVIVHYNIFISGVTFDTGGIDKDFFATDFDEFGQSTVTFIKTGDAGSNCHRTSVFQGSVRIGLFF